MNETVQRSHAKRIGRGRIERRQKGRIPIGRSKAECDRVGERPKKRFSLAIERALQMRMKTRRLRQGHIQVAADEKAEIDVVVVVLAYATVGERRDVTRVRSKQSQSASREANACAQRRKPEFVRKRFLRSSDCDRPRVPSDVIGRRRIELRQVLLQIEHVDVLIVVEMTEPVVVRRVPMEELKVVRRLATEQPHGVFVRTAGLARRNLLIGRHVEYELVGHEKSIATNLSNPCVNEVNETLVVESQARSYDVHDASGIRWSMTVRVEVRGSEE